MTDIEIAQANQMEPIAQIAKKIGRCKDLKEKKL